MSKKKWHDYLDRLIEKPALERIYISHGVAIHQLRRAVDVLNQITRAFRATTGREDVTPSTLLAYMMNRRKAGDWVQLGTRAQQFEDWSEKLTDADFSVLLDFYLKLDEASDDYLLRPSLIKRIEEHFEKSTNKFIDGSFLVAAIIAKRKRGVWPKLRDWGFDDLKRA